MEELWEAADDSEQLQRLAFQIQERDLKLQIQEHELAILRAQQALGHKQGDDDTACLEVLERKIRQA